MVAKLTQNEVYLRINEKLGSAFKVIDQYKSAKTKMKILHTICGRELLLLPKDIFSGKSGCIYCANKNKKSLADVPIDIQNDYEILEKPENFSFMTIITVRHKCGYTFNTSLSKLVRGRKCNKCFGNARLTNDEFLERVSKLERFDEFKILDEYINYDTPISFKCLKCKKILKRTPDKLLSKKTFSCKFCDSLSNGERTINHILNDLKINFIFDKSLPELNTQRLRFDFIIDSLKMIIEFDGEQHFLDPIKLPKSNMFYNKTEKVKHYDQLKNRLISDNDNYTLIRFNNSHISLIKVILTQILRDAIIPEELIRNNQILFISKELKINLDSYYTSVLPNYFKSFEY